MDNGDTPVTRSELRLELDRTKDEILEQVQGLVLNSKADTLDRVQEMVRDSKAELLERMRESQAETLDRVQELVRDSQTEVLKAFLPYQETQNVRMRALETKLSNTDAGITERMSIVERRLAEIEKKLLLNPPAA